MLSISHLIIIFLVALIVFGPEKLPELARTLSKAMLEFNRATGSLKQTLQDEMRQLEREIDEQKSVKRPLPPVSQSSPAESVPDSPPGTAKPVPGSTTESPVVTPAGDENTASDPASGKPTNGHPTAA
jgi:TatA/E family protein of Tat protein translocase